MKNSMVKKLCVRASIAASTPQRVEENKAHDLEKFRIGVLGASGYTGSEVAFILHTFFFVYNVFCNLSCWLHLHMVKDVVFIIVRACLGLVRVAV